MTGVTVSTKAKVYSVDCDIGFFCIVFGVIKTDRLTAYMFIVSMLRK